MINHDIIDDALGLIGVLAETEEASLEQCEHALRKLNNLLSQWLLDGIDLEWSPQTMDDIGAEAPLPVGTENAVIYYLAFAEAPHYGKQVTPEMASAGASFYAALLRRAMNDQLNEVRSGLPYGDGQLLPRTDITQG